MMLDLPQALVDKIYSGILLNFEMQNYWPRSEVAESKIESDKDRTHKLTPALMAFDNATCQ